MKARLQQDRRRRQQFSRQELRSLFFRTLLRTPLLPFARRAALYPRWSVQVAPPVRLRNRCWLTGRAASPLPFFRLSRHSFRQLARAGQLAGVAPASW